MKSKKIVYLISEDWYFYSHRFDLAKASIKQGYQVTLITRVGQYGDIITKAGINLIDVNFRRAVGNPLADLIVLFRVSGIYRKIKPDIVHHVSLKPILIGSIACLFNSVPIVINAVTGLGNLFLSGNKSTAMLRMLVKPVLLSLLNRRNSWVILQNQDDRKDLIAQGMRTECSELIKGSGVNLERFSYSVESNAIPVIMLAARMLRYKGIGEFVEAARLCVKGGLKARFVLVGDVDSENPMSLTREDLEQWHNEGIVEWWGHHNDMPDVMRKASIVCLPTYYREGLPKTLLEAAASGRPVIATDVPGCREIVINEENGLLVPVKNAERLARAITRLAENKQLRIKMGEFGRKLVESEFSVDIINRRTLALYERALSS
ncbi:MAG: glycosyltransferase family 4 protein [Proteobacteria bacterium]|nr:glycosyltransferase family 4 protein [Pseudomonadota bacterium]